METLKTYTFDELDTAAKEHARDKRRDDAVQDDWWDHVHENAVRMGALMGIEVGENVTRTIGGRYAKEYDIQFSGFSSQGDGCCWSGYLETQQLAGSVERIKEETGWNEAMEDNELIVLAMQAEELHAMITAVQVANRLSPVDGSGDPDVDWPDCEIGIRIAVSGEERYFRTKVDSSILPSDIEKNMDRFVHAFAAWIYKQLEAEHDYLTSDEYIDERTKELDLSFDEDGNDE